MTDSVLAFADAQLDASIERLAALMRVPSVSTDPAYAADCRHAAEQLAAELAQLGFAARVADTPGHPMVVAHHDGDGPHVLFYGHYDVQPVDPIALWTRDPFDPWIDTRADGSKTIVGRGASDDKGQLRTFVEACRAWKEVEGRLPAASPSCSRARKNRARPAWSPSSAPMQRSSRPDFALICDTLMWDRDTPGITIGLRGMAAGQVTVRGPRATCIRASMVARRATRSSCLRAFSAR